MNERGPIFLISGTPGAGKTSVATALMHRFPFGLHIPVDDLRGWVVSGMADPLPVWTDETTRQFRLARRTAAKTAAIYADAGFAVAIDDVLFPLEAQAVILDALEAYTVHKVLLRPDPDVALHRNATRTNKDFDTAVLAETIRQLSQPMFATAFVRAGWLIVDSTHLSLEETVDEILRQAGEP